MSLPIPRLDDRTYADLVADAVAQIPSLAPEWTNHNASDPGITLLELLAWRVEMLLYRTDQVPPEHVRAFLRLLNGPDVYPPPGRPLERQIADTVLALRDPVRAVTAEDWERHASEGFTAWRRGFEADERGWAARDPDDDAPDPLEEWWSVTGLERVAQNLPSAIPPVAWAKCFPRRDLTLWRDRDLPGHLSVVPVADWGGRAPDPAAEERLCRALWGYLDERRLVATWHHVVAPVRVPVRVRVVAALREDIPRTVSPSDVPDDLEERRRMANALRGAMEMVLGITLPSDERDRMVDALREGHRRLWEHLPADPREAVRDELRRFLDPVHGGKEGEGWTLGRDVYLSDLYARIERLDFVESVPLVLLESTCPEGAAGCAPAPVEYNDDGQTIAVHLGGPQFPWLVMEPDDVFLATSLVRVGVEVRLAGRRSSYRGEELAGLRAAARLAFPPLYAPPPGEDRAPGTVDVRTAEIRAEMLRRSGLPPEKLLSVTLHAAPERLVRDRTGAVAAVRFREGEMAEVGTDLLGTEPEENETR